MRAYPRIAPGPKIEPKLDLSNVDLDDLAALVAVVMAAQRAAPIGSVVAPLVVRVGDKIEEIQRRLVAGEKIRFRDWIGLSASRVEIIVSFLAVLELMKLRKIVVHQDKLFGEIVIEAAVAPPPAAVEPAATSATEDDADEPSFVEPQS